MYTIKKIIKTDLKSLINIAIILNACGKNMAREFNLHHWDNSLIKSFLIVLYRSIDNKTYLLYDSEKPIATFMLRIQNNNLHFEKLAVLPNESRRGVGSFCLKKIEEIAIKHNCKKISLEVYEHSKHAIDFYLHKGFAITKKKESLKYNEFSMEKSLV